MRDASVQLGLAIPRPPAPQIPAGHPPREMQGRWELQEQQGKAEMQCCRACGKQLRHPNFDAF